MPLKLVSCNSPRRKIGSVKWQFNDKIDTQISLNVCYYRPSFEYQHVYCEYTYNVIRIWIHMFVPEEVFLRQNPYVASRL